MRQHNKVSLQNGVKSGHDKTVFIAAYLQLKEQWDQVTLCDGECAFIDYTLEEGNLPDSLDLPNAEELVLLLPDDIRSHILLRYIARDFKGEIFIAPICGQYTDIAPLAVSDSEFVDCLGNITKLNDSKCEKLCAKLSETNTHSDCFYKLRDDKIQPLPRKEVYDYIIGQLKGEMKMTHTVGLCMGNAPKGWPITDVFYLNRIDELIETGQIAITQDNDNPFQRYIRLR